MVGALDAAGRPFSAANLVKLATVATVAGLAVALAGYPAWALKAQLIATPILLFGVVQFVLRFARGPRARGLLCLAGATIVLGTVSSAYLLAGFIPSTSSTLSVLAAYVTRYSGYADAIAIVLLGGAAIVLIVQDAFLEAVQAHGEQLQAVAAADRAATLSRVVSEVVRGLGHPIDVMLRRTDVLLESPGAPSAPDALREIRQQADRARHLIDDLEAYVRTLGGPEGFVDLSEVARMVAMGVAGEALRSGITLELDLSDGTAPVRADRAMVEQIIRGVLDNALEAAGQGGRVQLSSQLGARGVEVVVQDSGPGVLNEDVPKLFVGGFTTKEGGKETGLGLSLLAQLARSSGGSLRYENRPTPGFGARFVLTFPFAELHPPHI